MEKTRVIIQKTVDFVIWKKFRNLAGFLGIEPDDLLNRAMRELIEREEKKK